MKVEPIRIDLVSDTATKPSNLMRHAMFDAEVGDEQRQEDPTVNKLTERVAKLLGQDQGLFLPSGTMCNQIAIATHCSPGDEIIAAKCAHIISSEGAGAAVFAGSFVHPISSKTGIFSRQDVYQAVKDKKIKSPRSRLLAVEQTCNRGGGSVWKLERINSVVEAAKANGLVCHMDGARLMNAVIASDVSAQCFGESFDSVWLDFSKGLGCPFGGILAGSESFISQANVWKHRFGGALRQAGVVAAAALYALDNNISRLADDHKNAKNFAKLISDIPGVKLVFKKIETNIVFFDLTVPNISPREVVERLLCQGIRLGLESDTRMRVVTHMDISREDIQETATAMRQVLS